MTFPADVTPVEVAAVAAAIGFLVIAVFQAALALGAPLGRAAWGGATAVLPSRLRISSAVACVIWLIAPVIVLGRAGIEVVAVPRDLLAWGTWALVVLSVLGAVVNFASSSPWERFGWGPLAALLAVLSLVVASSPGG
jgi:hypothetical protein